MLGYPDLEGYLGDSTSLGPIVGRYANRIARGEFTLGGDLVTPISDMMAGQLGVGQWTFDTPVRKFGGWWENNSGADDATVEFFAKPDE